MGYRVRRVLSRAVSSWSRSPGGCGFRGVFQVGRIFFVLFFRFSYHSTRPLQYFFERTRPAASMNEAAFCLIYLSTSNTEECGKKFRKIELFSENLYSEFINSFIQQHNWISLVARRGVGALFTYQVCMYHFVRKYNDYKILYCIIY